VPGVTNRTLIVDDDEDMRFLLRSVIERANEGLEVAEVILAEDSAQSIILFSAYLDDDLIARADAIGVRACISKDRYDDIPDALWRYGPAA
jgi:AmiR/NasT family two-component response regulator